uniref:Transmembrane protein n=1 Tax=Populus trichocarpa TaxID=3694 RepID=A0A2K1XKK1_POPTR
MLIIITRAKKKAVPLKGNENIERQGRKKRFRVRRLRGETCGVAVLLTICCFVSSFSFYVRKRACRVFLYLCCLMV